MTKTQSYDVVIIGAGTAGLAALREIKRHTDRVAIINDGPYGTTCARVGCMPSKALIEAANAFHRRNSFAELGIDGAGELRADLPRVLARVRRLRDRFTQGVIAITDEMGERSVAGRARFVDPHTIEVNGRRLRAERVIIATGSRPIVPDAWRALGPRLLTSDTLFEQHTLPHELAVIGMGSIGTEIAQALARLGLRVSAFGSKPLIAGLSDERVNDALTALLRNEMSLHLGDRARLEPTDDGRVRVLAGATTLIVDGVLAALGRRPNLDDLALERLGVELDEHGMPPFDTTTRQIASLPVYIAGDVADELGVLHEAADDGYIAGTNVTSDTSTCFERRVPLRIVFCAPNVAVVGTPLAQLDREEIEIGTVEYAGQSRARIADEDQGLLRVYAARGDGRLLGAELCAPRGEHLAHLLALAITRNHTVQDLLRMPFYHPTFEEGLRTALRDLSKRLGLARTSDLANCNPVGATALD